jgi:hypothetical protein
MKTLSLTLIILLILTTNAYADCEFQGQTYPTGTRIGSRVCQPDGTWKSS